MSEETVVTEEVVAEGVAAEAIPIIQDDGDGLDAGQATADIPGDILGI